MRIVIRKILNRLEERECTGINNNQLPLEFDNLGVEYEIKEKLDSLVEQGYAEYSNNVYRITNKGKEIIA